VGSACCQLTPVRVAETAATRPWASEVSRLTPDKPRAVRARKKVSQPVWDSAEHTSTPRVSRHTDQHQAVHHVPGLLWPRIRWDHQGKRAGRLATSGNGWTHTGVVPFNQVASSLGREALTQE
jgi:hypothetical protein